MVGATAAHTMAVRGVADEIVLIDVAEDLVRGQATDINHAAGYMDRVRVSAGDYEDIGENDVVVVTCGLPRRPDQTRLDLMQANAGIVREVVGKITAKVKPAFLVMVTNPVDVMTYVAWQTSGLPRERVIGTGTMLDTARLRVALANALNVAPADVLAYVLGEHGDSSVTALAGATLAGVPLANAPGYTEELAQGLEDGIRVSSQKIIEAKKSTYYGIAQVVTRLVEALDRRAATVLPVSSVVEGEYGLGNHLALGLPALVSSSGAHILEGYPLSEDEQRKLVESAETVRKAVLGSAVTT